MQLASFILMTTLHFVTTLLEMQRNLSGHALVTLKMNTNRYYYFQKTACISRSRSASGVNGTLCQPPTEYVHFVNSSILYLCLNNETHEWDKSFVDHHRCPHFPATEKKKSYFDIKVG